MTKFFAPIAALLLVTSANAALIEGNFVFQGTLEGGRLSPSFVPEAFQFDTYTFEVTNNSTQVVTGFGTDAVNNISFGGTMLQDGGLATRANTQLTASVFDPALPGDQFTPDSFFIVSGTGAAVGAEDTTSGLSASTVGSTGNVIQPGSTGVVAFFSVPVGEVPTGGIGADAYAGSTLVGQIMPGGPVIPEPTSIAMLALAGVAGLRRRR